ncbi:SDR family oxidoreductase [Ktedonospora formicarum]|uniref:3-ketoacyl-ACP reductase n=1 Tax=Ktedonospora formicarum TaxID=2778364 RepID=A0A8J3I365_9CHLR|nr:SDR family oxidoreductase [Ktedonospora formicarum]GHO46741.1 3-ketoacyl-ACP reductase [Ktedonospora formicarum]
MGLNTTQKRIAIVTGVSRDRGIGTAICKALASMNIDIFFTHWGSYDQEVYGTHDETRRDLPTALRALGVRCEGMEVDMSHPQAATQIMDEIEARLGSPTILVNNAAYSVSDGYEQLTAEILDAHYTVNMRGTFLLSVEFARRFSSTSGGRIVNLVSGQDWPMPHELAYASTKGAIAAFTISLSADLASRGITVNAVDPGATDTGWMSEELKRELLAKAPFGRLGQPEDAARLIAFLASEEARWITGQILHSRGGM